MSGPVVTRCSECRVSLKLKSAEAFGKTLSCPRCGEEFVARPIRRKRRPQPSDQQHPSPNSPSASDAGRSTMPRMPGRGRSRKSTPIEEARRKRDALLKKQAEEAEARRPREAAMATVALVIWINAHIAVCLTMLDCVMEIIDLVQDGSVRQIRTPLVIMALAGIAWFHSVLPRDINQRGVAAGIGFFFIIVCGVAGYIAVTATNSLYGYEFFQVRWGAVYLGVALNLFAIWGFGSETRVEYAERMMSRGRFGSANRAIERELEKNPDNLQALQIQRELKEMIRLV